MSNPLTARKTDPGFRGQGGPPFWHTQYWSATIWIIVITCVVSLIDMFALEALTRVGALSLWGIRHLYFWQILTYQLLHAGPFHLIINMLWLYMLGPMIEPVLGKLRYILLYVVCGLVGGAAFLLVQRFGIGGVDPRAILVGASGSILGVMAAATCAAPRMPIRFWFPPITIQLWVIFLIAVVLALLAVRTSGGNAGGEAAHLGGAITGFIAFTFRKQLRLTPTRKTSKFWNPSDPATKFFRDVD